MAREFAINLAKAGEKAKDIKPKLDSVFGEDSLFISQIYRLVAAVKDGGDLADSRHGNVKKTMRTIDLIIAVDT